MKRDHVKQTDRGENIREIERFFPAPGYDLSATLSSGQAFRWEQVRDGWEGVVGKRWVRLVPEGGGIQAVLAEPVDGWDWLRSYLQLDVAFDRVLATFPRDPAMERAVDQCSGLRLLRQDPWECLASFILSSTKQIVQIKQIIRALCEKHGQPVTAGLAGEQAWAFPDPDVVANLTELELRACKMGFRAPHLLGTARMIISGKVNLGALGAMPLESAREQLLELPGVGRKIADCVLLFAYGFQSAFPVDVWIAKGLRQLYFKGRNVPLARLQEFSRTYFGPYGGYAQQYLFHYWRIHAAAELRARKRYGKKN